MKLYIYSLDKTLYEGEARIVTLPAEDGEIGVLDKHIPLVTPLKKGVVKIGEDVSKKEFPIAGGFCQVNKNKVILLVS